MNVKSLIPNQTTVPIIAYTSPVFRQRVKLIAARRQTTMKQLVIDGLIRVIAEFQDSEKPDSVE